MMGETLSRFAAAFWRRRPDETEAAKELYRQAVAQARQPDFYEAGVSDTLEGRYDFLMLHIFAVMRRLRDEGDEGREAGQHLVDTFFDDMDAVLREMGVGDLSVAKKIRAMAEMFYGRVTAYDAALNSHGSAALDDPLQQALARNLFADDPLAQEKAGRFTAYMKKLVGDLENQEGNALMAGRVVFPSAAALAPVEQSAE